MATLEDAKTICREIPEEDLGRLSTWITLEERPRRREERRIADAEAELVAQLQEQHPELAPDYATHVEAVDTLEDLFVKLPAWVQPTSKASSYPPMSLVKHQDKAWRARRLTDKEPGTPFSGWEDVTADFLRPEPIADGNDPEVGTDAPGLITEPEPEVTPAAELQEWKAGEWYSKGESVRVGNVAYTSLKLHRATDATHPTKNTPEWLKLG